MRRRQKAESRPRDDLASEAHCPLHKLRTTVTPPRPVARSQWRLSRSLRHHLHLRVTRTRRRPGCWRGASDTGMGEKLSQAASASASLETPCPGPERSQGVGGPTCRGRQVGHLAELGKRGGVSCHTPSAWALSSRPETECRTPVCPLARKGGRPAGRSGPGGRQCRC